MQKQVYMKTIKTTNCIFKLIFRCKSTTTTSGAHTDSGEHVDKDQLETSVSIHCAFLLDTVGQELKDHQIERIQLRLTE